MYSLNSDSDSDSEREQHRKTGARLVNRRGTGLSNSVYGTAACIGLTASLCVAGIVIFIVVVT